MKTHYYLCDVMVLFRDARDPCCNVKTYQIRGILEAFDGDFLLIYTILNNGKSTWTRFCQSTFSELPKISMFMVCEFIKRNDKFNAAEIRNAKAAM